MLRGLPDPLGFLDQKIDELLRIKGKVFCKEILPDLQEIDKIKDSFSRWFWLQVLKTRRPVKEYVAIIKNQRHLKRLKVLLQDKGRARRHADFEQKRDLAKQTPIQNLYPFNKLRRSGRRWMASCPFHDEKTPSFVIYPENTFHCFGCQAHGDAISFARKVNGLDFQQAVLQLTGGLS